jgi:aminopeptidase N
MLRRYLGDEAFWRAIRYYTQVNGGSNVETTDLKKAFEVVTGKNLYWFFDQWVYQAGLPKLEVKTRYDRRNRLVNLTLKQSSSGKEEVIYKLPMTVLIDDGDLRRTTIFFEDSEATFTIPAQHPPKMVIVDEGWQIPKYLTFKKRPAELMYQLEHAPEVLDRIWAARELSQLHATKTIAEALISSVKNDPFWGVRVEAANAFKALKPRQGYKQLLTALQDQDPRVLTACIKTLGAYAEPVVRDTLLALLRRDKHEYVISAALEALTKVDYDSARQVVDWALEQDSHEEVIRRAAINILKERKTEANYQRLLSLAAYGGTAYNARPAAVSALASFGEDYPEIVEKAMDWLEDPNWRVRSSAFSIVGKYGEKDHLSTALAVLQYEVRSAMLARTMKGYLEGRIENGNKRKTSRREVRELQEILDQLEEIISPS